MFRKLTLLGLGLVFVADVGSADGKNPIVGSHQSVTLGNGKSKANHGHHKSVNVDLTVSDLKWFINTPELARVRTIMAKLNAQLFWALTREQVKNEANIAAVNAIMARLNANTTLAMIYGNQRTVDVPIPYLRGNAGDERLSDMDVKMMWFHDNDSPHWKEKDAEPSADELEWHQQAAIALLDRLSQYGVDNSVGKNTLESLDRMKAPTWLMQLIAQKIRERDEEAQRREALWKENKNHHSSNTTYSRHQ